MSPDRFNQCSECHLILSARSAQPQISCPRCLMAGNDVVMRLVPIQGPKVHYDTSGGRATRVA